MKRILCLLDNSIECVVFLIMLIITVIGGTQVVCRYVVNISLTWSEELLRYLLIWLVFLAIGVGVRRQAHMGMNVVVEKCSKSVQTIFSLMSNIVTMIFGGIIVYYTLQLMQVATYQTTPALGLSISIVYCGMVIGGLYTLLTGLRFSITAMTALRQRGRG